jgi:hypothetical protein
VAHWLRRHHVVDRQIFPRHHLDQLKVVAVDRTIPNSSSSASNGAGGKRRGARRFRSRPLPGSEYAAEEWRCTGLAVQRHAAVSHEVKLHRVARAWHRDSRDQRRARKARLRLVAFVIEYLTWRSRKSLSSAAMAGSAGRHGDLQVGVPMRSAGQLTR